MTPFARALAGLIALACWPAVGGATTPQWSTHEITLTSDQDYGNPYLEVEVSATFTNEAGESWRRPAFWDGGRTWKVRFAPPDDHHRWQWTVSASDPRNAGLHGKTGTLQAAAPDGGQPLVARGLLKMSPGGRSIVQHSGAPFLMVADTAWSLPFRATAAQVEQYARQRRAQGFNAVLLSAVQPDRNAEGPNARNTPLGFARAFEDLSQGRLERLDPAYFQALDQTVNTLLEQDLVPVYAVMLHGYGWKGQGCVGNALRADEYVRFCQYLLARYGSAPAVWLLTVDGAGNGPGVQEGGEMLDRWDGYCQPTGIHYNPCDDFIAEWAKELADPRQHCLHGNKRHQAAAWLDFQWAQTGHDGRHLYHKVEKMFACLPIKAVANGEPTYEGMQLGTLGLGWWQGEEAWMQLMSGGTMGVVYGACSVWRWKITPDEPGWEAWTEHAISWEQALHLEGARYVGLLGKILAAYDLTDIERRWDLAGGKPLLAHPGRLYVAYLNAGGEIAIAGLPPGLAYRWVNPKTGAAGEPRAFAGEKLTAPSDEPWVLIMGR